MKIKLDENLPHSLSRILGLLGYDTATVIGEGLTGCGDDEVWRVAQSEGRFLITQDMDFSDTRRFLPDTHYGVLLVRLHSPSTRSLIQRVENIFQTEDVESWLGCFVVASDRKVRVRRA